MSYLDRPRLHFYGKALVNPPTANNTPADWKDIPYYNPGQVALDLRGSSPEQFREWLHQLNPEGYTNALWNYYGDNGIRFADLKITSADRANGQRITRPEDDPCIGSQIDLLGSPYGSGRTPAILVDLDPTDGFTTQFFGQFLSISQDSHHLLTADAPIKGYSRWINFWRNLEVAGDRGSSAVWQIAFPREALTFSDAIPSPALREFYTAAGQAQGMVARFCFYLFYHLPYREIDAAYKAGNRQAMPGGLIVSGTLGVWQSGEPATQPPARLLMPDVSHALPIPESIDSRRRFVDFYLGVTPAQVDTARQVIVLDLVNTLPEIAGFDTLNEDSIAAPEKVNLGDISLHVQDTASGARQCIGVIPFDQPSPDQPGYSKASYILSGGIVEIAYTPDMEDQLIKGDLVLLHGTEPNSPVLLRENPYHVMLDQRSIYLELEDQTPLNVPFQVLKRGQPLSEPLTLKIEQSINDSSRFSAQHSPSSPLSLARDAASHPPEHTQDHRLVQPAENIVAVSAEITTDSQGRGMLSIAPLRAGMCKIWLSTPDDPDLSVVSIPSMAYFLKNALHYFINVRVLPDDSHYDQVQDADLTWAFMTEHFFRYYSLLYPIMNTYIDFDDEMQTRTRAALIAAFVDETWQANTLYMPITREMSAGKRRLVKRWASL